MYKYLTVVLAATAISVVLIAWSNGNAAPKKRADKTNAATSSIDRGRYLVEIGGCNDCHTEAFAPSGGTIPTSEWLKGSVVGFKGPWGTTYPKNLRQTMSRMSESDWVSYAKTASGLPPMPWWALKAYTEKDLRDIYAFVRSLGAVGADVPAVVAPGTEPAGPYIDFNVHNLPTDPTKH